MALPTQTSFKTLDIHKNGLPFICLDLTGGNCYTMDYHQNGLPFVFNSLTGENHNIKKVNSVSWWSRVKKFGGKLTADINKVNTTEP